MVRCTYICVDFPIYKDIDFEMFAIQILQCIDRFAYLFVVGKVFA